MVPKEKLQFPVFIEKDEDGFFVAECPVLESCFTQGQTLDEALKNIEEVTGLCVEEKRDEVLSHMRKAQDFGFHTVAINV
ncbi:MAG: type II toxin-antitoxin system HicB family antitoxin [archaeon]